MRSPIFSTRPLATLRILASSTVSAPVTGLVLTTLTVSPTELLEQLLRRQQIELEVLLEHAELAAVAVEQRRLRPQLGADVDEGEVLDAGLEGHAAAVLHQGQVLVVDGDRHRRLVGLGDLGLRNLAWAHARGGTRPSRPRRRRGRRMPAARAGGWCADSWIPLSGWLAAGGRLKRPYTPRAFRRKWGGGTDLSDRPHAQRDDGEEGSPQSHEGHEEVSALAAVRTHCLRVLRDFVVKPADRLLELESSDGPHVQREAGCRGTILMVVGYPLAKLTEQPYADCVERWPLISYAGGAWLSLPPGIGVSGTDTRCQRSIGAG